MQKNHHALVVEDDEGIQTLIRKVLELEGVEATIVKRGDDAIAALRNRPFSLVILDLMLPAVNGFEVLRYMHACCAKMLGRTAVITAASDATIGTFETRKDLLALLRKPFELEDLQRVIRTVTLAPIGEPVFKPTARM